MLPLLHAASGPYQFHWHMHGDVVLFCIVLLAAYFWAITQLRPMISDAGRVRRSQIVLYVSGVLSIYAVAGTPVHDLSEQYLLSFHMFQHAVFALVSAPLLLAGIPAWLWQALLRQPHVMPVAKVLTNPLVAFGIFNAFILFTHLPGSVDVILNHHWLHFVAHAALLLSAMLMWWPVLSTVPELPALSPPLKMAYLFMQSLLPSVLSSFITFADGAVYPFYEQAPRTWGLSAQADQQIAGGVMKIFGSLIIWSFIAVTFFRWWEREQAESRADPAWPDVQDELEAMGLTRRR